MPYRTPDGGSNPSVGPSLSDLQRLLGQRKSQTSDSPVGISSLLQQFLAEQQQDQGSFNGFDARMMPLSAATGDSGGGTAHLGHGPSYSDNLMGFLNGILPVKPKEDNFGVNNVKPTEQQQSPSALEALVSQLSGLIGGGMSSSDYEAALERSNDAINSGFNAQMNAVRAASSHAEGTTKKNNKKIDAMYRALTNSYKSAANTEVNHAEQYQNQLKNITGYTERGIQGSADHILNEQAALAQGLGVESATPQIQAAQANQVQKQVTEAAKSGNRDLRSSMKQSQAQQQFMDRQGQASGFEGNERQADLISQLDAYLQGNEGKIADIKGALAQALASNEAQMKQAFSSSQKDAFSQSLGLANLLRGLENDKFEHSQAGDSEDPIAGLMSKSEQLSQLLNSQTGNPKLLNDFLLTPSMRSQTTPNGGRMNPLEARAQALEWGKSHGLSGQNLTLFVEAAYNAQKALG